MAEIEVEVEVEAEAEAEVEVEVKADGCPVGRIPASRKRTHSN